MWMSSQLSLIQLHSFSVTRKIRVSLTRTSSPKTNKTNFFKILDIFTDFTHPALSFTYLSNCGCAISKIYHQCITSRTYVNWFTRMNNPKFNLPGWKSNCPAYIFWYFCPQILTCLFGQVNWKSTCQEAKFSCHARVLTYSLYHWYYIYPTWTDKKRNGQIHFWDGPVLFVSVDISLQMFSLVFNVTIFIGLLHWRMVSVYLAFRWRVNAPDSVNLRSHKSHLYGRSSAIKTAESLPFQFIFFRHSISLRM